MKDLLKKMAQVANELDLQGLEKEANKITQDMLKIAQTVPSGMLQERMQQGQFKLQQSSLDEINKFISEHNLSREDAYSWIKGKFDARQANDWAAMTTGQPGAAGGVAGAAGGVAGAAGGVAGAAGGGAGASGGGAGASGASGGPGGTITYDAAKQQALIARDGDSQTYKYVFSQLTGIDKNVNTLNEMKNKYNVAENAQVIRNINQMISVAEYAITQLPYLFQGEKTDLVTLTTNIHNVCLGLIEAYGAGSYTPGFLGGKPQGIQYDENKKQMESVAPAIKALQKQIISSKTILEKPGERGVPLASAAATPAAKPAASGKPLYGPPLDLTNFNTNIKK